MFYLTLIGANCLLYVDYKLASEKSQKIFPIKSNLILIKHGPENNEIKFHILQNKLETFTLNSEYEIFQSSFLGRVSLKKGGMAFSNFC